jgi:hypothetical protein
VTEEERIASLRERAKAEWLELRRGRDGWLLDAVNRDDTFWTARPSFVGRQTPHLGQIGEWISWRELCGIFGHPSPIACLIGPAFPEGAQ